MNFIKELQWKKVLITGKYSHLKIDPEVLESIAELFVEDNWEKVIEIYLNYCEDEKTIYPSSKLSRLISL